MNERVSINKDSIYINNKNVTSGYNIISVIIDHDINDTQAYITSKVNVTAADYTYRSSISNNNNNNEINNINFLSSKTTTSCNNNKKDDSINVNANDNNNINNNNIKNNINNIISNNNNNKNVTNNNNTSKNVNAKYFCYANSCPRSRVVPR
ncbi:hypothetical protein HELRODRAFT_177177 [Helobdella robusta]|uniref:Uncharacterized protein n=1 Tax=Helobdella robusta TaxID=6412 RepID=T1FBB8_HELRO|nr:hypothetical protein HELRODRAFT_177177 [Helobdella robusta]ESN98295.1 hypothetical protein HELRODRAFT_177177 [Helobdella robusta]